MDDVMLALIELNQLAFGPWVAESIVGGLARACGEVVEQRMVHGAWTSPLCGRAGLEGRVTAAVGRLSDRKHLWRTWRDVAGDFAMELVAEGLITQGNTNRFFIICKKTFKIIAPLMNTQGKAVRHKNECGRLLIDMTYQLAPGLLIILSKRTTHALLERCDPITEKFRSSNLSSILIIALLKSILP